MSALKRIVRDQQLDEITATMNTDAVDLENAGAVEALIAIAAVVVATPAAKAFATTDVDVDEDTITEVAHGFKTGLKGQFTTTTTLPDGLSLITDYFVIRTDADTYQVATSLANALAGTAVDLIDDGTGTHTFTPTSIAGGTVKPQASEDGTNWFDIKSPEGVALSQNITVTANFMFNIPFAFYKYFRMAYGLTAGYLTTTTTVVGKGRE